MSLQTTTNLNVDFYDNKYILINAKQYDSSSRWITITCYNQGSLFNLSASKHTAYIRYKKADGNGVLNSCRINYKGEILVELTEQMLAASGICYVDLIVVNKGSAIVNIDTGEIITIDNSEIMSTMAFCINVYEAAVDNSLIESSYEFDSLNKMLQSIEADYKEVIQLSKSYAIGDANNIRENENYDNSKYYYNLARSYTVGDNNMRANEDVDNAEYYYQMSKSYSVGDTDINIRENEDYDNSKYYYQLSKSYAVGDTGLSERVDENTDNAKHYSELAAISEDNAKTSEINAKNSEISANQSKEDSFDYAILSQRYAKGNTNTVENESIDNAEYYYKMAKSYTVGSADGMREDEDIDNAKYYYQLSKSRADSAIESEINTRTYMNNTKEYMDGTETYMNNSLEYMNDSYGYMNNAKSYMDNAFDSEANAKESELRASESADRAEEISSNISVDFEGIENNAKIASESAESALKNCEETKDMYLQVKSMATDLNGAFIPMGTIEFAELGTLLENGEVKAGYLYHIVDAFISDDTFKKVGIEYVAGTNVYYTSDGYWDCLINHAIATVNEVMEFLGI